MCLRVRIVVKSPCGPNLEGSTRNCFYFSFHVHRCCSVIDKGPQGRQDRGHDLHGDNVWCSIWESSFQLPCLGGTKEWSEAVTIPSLNINLTRWGKLTLGTMAYGRKRPLSNGLWTSQRKPQHKDTREIISEGRSVRSFLGISVSWDASVLCALKLCAPRNVNVPEA